MAEVEVETSWTYDILTFIQTVLQWGWIGWIILFFAGIIILFSFAGWIEHHVLIRIKLKDRLRFVFNTFYFLLIERIRFFLMIWRLIKRIHKEHKKQLVIYYLVFGSFFGTLLFLIFAF